jgi:NDP-sugar pyrophosphorylase family protein
MRFSPRRRTEHSDPARGRRIAKAATAIRHRHCPRAQSALVASSGIQDIWINVHYEANAIREVLGDGKNYGVRLRYVYEPCLLGTAVALRNLPSTVAYPILVVYGDNLLKFELWRLADRHRDTQPEATVVAFDQSHHVSTGIAGGRIVCNAQGFATRFIEHAACTSTIVNAGVYLVEASILDLLPPGQFMDFGRDLFPTMLRVGRRLAIHMIEPGGYCLGLDTPESYAKGLRLFQSRQLNLP